ncbi:MAG TPA: LLM class flavin-dependent oxidoreductase [Microthrixaceae bacterium]|nr:LLM class flavin-dependent oxidoreductase [Microthrixaceae bacterium]
MDWPLRCGIFMAPFHPNGQNPTLALERDLELVEHLDRIGFHEAWIGEHHSGGFELISSPELFIAAAAERTKHIDLGTGVVSLPYHNPFMTAQRIVQLDHMTRGRVKLGVGPGALPSDAFMLGIDPADQRARMEEALEVVLHLLRSDEPITRETDWFTLRDARLHLRPYTHPHPEVAVAAMISPSGPRAAGRFGCSLLSIGATQRAGIDLLGQAWEVMEERSEQFGNVADRRQWRLVTMMHLAETREQAALDVEYGLADYARYFREVAALPLFPDAPIETIIETLKGSGTAVIGTPDDAIELIQHLIDESNGGFGTILLQAHEWANSLATKRSYELFSQYVLPHFDAHAASTTSSMEWVMSNRSEQLGAAMNAIGAAIQLHADEKADLAASNTPG